MATKKTAAKTAVKKATQSDADIASLLNQAAELDEDNKAELGSGGNRVPYIKCISKAEDPVLDKSSPDYIPKAQYKGFCVPDHSLNLGLEFFYTPMGIFSIYEEKIKPKDSNGIPQIVGYWMPEEARQIPVAEGSYFDRHFVGTDGELHILSPVYWVFGLIKDHEDIGMVNMAFRSSAAPNAKGLQKILGKIEGPSCQAVVKVTAERKEFKNYGSVTYRPVFEGTERRNFVLKAKGFTPKEWTKAEVAEYAKLYSDLQTDYSDNKMVAKQRAEDKVAALPEHTSESDPRF